MEAVFGLDGVLRGQARVDGPEVVFISSERQLIVDKRNRIDLSTLEKKNGWLARAFSDPARTVSGSNKKTPFSRPHPAPTHQSPQ